jgi:hypothetical protein
MKRFCRIKTTSKKPNSLTFGGFKILNGKSSDEHIQITLDKGTSGEEMDSASFTARKILEHCNSGML